MIISKFNLNRVIGALLIILATWVAISATLGKYQEYGTVIYIIPIVYIIIFHGISLWKTFFLKEEKPFPKQKLVNTNINYWLGLTKDFSKPNHGRAALDFIPTLISVLFFMSISLWHSSIYGVFALETIIFTIPAVAFLCKIFIIQHDLGHGGYTANKKLNDSLGVMLSGISFIPYFSWKTLHAFHHALNAVLEVLGLGEIATLTVEEYNNLSSRKKFFTRIFRSVPVLIILGGISYLFYYSRFNTVKRSDLKGLSKSRANREWKKIEKVKRSKMFTNIFVVMFFTAEFYFLGFVTVLNHVLMLVVFMTGAIWFFYVQHQFEETYKRKFKDWGYLEAALLGSSYYKLPWIVNYFTGNIGVHHLHHLNERIPCYLLKLAHEKYKHIYEPVITILTFKASLDLWKINLYDYENKRPISFAENRRRNECKSNVHRFRTITKIVHGKLTQTCKTCSAVLEYNNKKMKTIKKGIYGA